MNKKQYEKVCELNSTYKVLINRANKCVNLIKSKNLECSLVWANNHFESYNNKFVCELYPIPVIDIKGIGDVGINVTGCFFEGYFSKNFLIAANLNSLQNINNLTLYGENNFLKDVYNSKMEFSKIKECISNSTETKIAINFPFKFSELSEVLNVLTEFVK